MTSTSTEHTPAAALEGADEDTIIGAGLRALPRLHAEQLAKKAAWRETLDERDRVVQVLLAAGVATWKITELTRTDETPNGLHFTSVGRARARADRRAGAPELAVAKENG